jgi:hypothetical protein
MWYRHARDTPASSSSARRPEVPVQRRVVTTRRKGRLGCTDHEDGAVGVAEADVAFCAGKCDANKTHLKKGTSRQREGASRAGSHGEVANIAAA